MDRLPSELWRIIAADDCLTKKDVVNLATVCRGRQEPAERVIWESLDGDWDGMGHCEGVVWVEGDCSITWMRGLSANHARKGYIKSIWLIGDKLAYAQGEQILSATSSQLERLAILPDDFSINFPTTRKWRSSDYTHLDRWLLFISSLQLPLLQQLDLHVGNFDVFAAILSHLPALRYLRMGANQSASRLKAASKLDWPEMSHLKHLYFEGQSHGLALLSTMRCKAPVLNGLDIFMSKSSGTAPADVHVKKFLGDCGITTLRITLNETSSRETEECLEILLGDRLSTWACVEELYLNVHIDTLLRLRFALPKLATITIPRKQWLTVTLCLNMDRRLFHQAFMRNPNLVAICEDCDDDYIGHHPEYVVFFRSYHNAHSTLDHCIYNRIDPAGPHGYSANVSMTRHFATYKGQPINAAILIRIYEFCGEVVDWHENGVGGRDLNLPEEVWEALDEHFKESRAHKLRWLSISE